MKYDRNSKPKNEQAVSPKAAPVEKKIEEAVSPKAAPVEKKNEQAVAPKAVPVLDLVSANSAP